jgi:hypothetical protein
MKRQKSAMSNPVTDSWGSEHVSKSVHSAHELHIYLESREPELTVLRYSLEKLEKAS